MSAPFADGSKAQAGDIITTTLGGKNGKPEQTVSYKVEDNVETESFGTVYLAKCTQTGETFVLKRFLQDGRYKNRELQLMAKMNHSNVLCFKHCFFSTASRDEDESVLNIVMDLKYVPRTIFRVLKDYNNQQQSMPLVSVKLYTYQIFQGLAYLHENGVCHMDLKPIKVLVNRATHEVKICDLGSAQMLVEGEANISYISSRIYLAPELIIGATEYTASVDIWSAGCILAELLLGQPLFPGEDNRDHLGKIIKVLGTPTCEEIRCMNPNYHYFTFPQIKAHPWRKVFHKRVPSQAIDLVSRLLQYSPSRRSSALEAMAHAFFDEIRWALSST